MDKKSVIKVAIDIVVIGIALAIGFVLKSKLAQPPIDYSHIPSINWLANWLLAAPFLLGMLFLVFWGYWTDWKTKR